MQVINKLFYPFKVNWEKSKEWCEVLSAAGYDEVKFISRDPDKCNTKKVDNDNFFLKPSNLYFDFTPY
jgi:hypothetical protein